MPNRIKRQSISPSVRLEIWAMPCAICRLPGRTEVDHIIPVASGGTSSRKNLQPLCVQCNAKKKHRLSNDELRRWFHARRIAHALEHFYQLDMKYTNPYDRDGVRAWMMRWL